MSDDPRDAREHELRATGGRSDERRTRRVEIVATVVLAVAAVATAWSTYQSTRWRGEQAEHASGATAAHIASAEATTRAGQLTQIDINAFSDWVDADVAGDQELAEVAQSRFREEFQPAFEAWLATNPGSDTSAPTTPFEMPDYRLDDAERAKQLNAVAVRRSHDANNAIRRSDDYMLAVVVFATALFFAGISSTFESPRRREVLVALGAVAFLAAMAWVTTLLVIDSW